MRYEDDVGVPRALANPAIALRLPSTLFVGRVAELASVGGVRTPMG